MACKCSLVTILWFKSKHNDNNDDFWDENCFQSQPSLYLLCEDDLGIELGSTGLRASYGSSPGKLHFLHLIPVNTKYVSRQCLCWCVCATTKGSGKETMSERQTQHCRSLNPRGSVSRTTPPQPGAPCTELNSWSLLRAVGHQVALATASRVVGGKVNFWSSCLLKCTRGFIIQ